MFFKNEKSVKVCFSVSKSMFFAFSSFILYKYINNLYGIVYLIKYYFSYTIIK